MVGNVSPLPYPCAVATVDGERLVLTEPRHASLSPAQMLTYGRSVLDEQGLDVPVEVLRPCANCREPATHYPRLRFRAKTGPQLEVVLREAPVCAACVGDEYVRRYFTRSRTVLEWADEQMLARKSRRIAPARTRLNFVPIPEEDRCSPPQTSNEQR